MYAMPKALPEYRHFKLAGEIVYNNRTERVPQGGIDQDFVQNLGSLIRRIAAPEPRCAFPAPRSAVSATSRWEDCLERIESVSHPYTPVTDDF